MHLGVPFRCIVPPPDGTIDTADLYGYGWLYARTTGTPAGYVCVQSASIAAPYGRGSVAVGYATGTVDAPNAIGTTRNC